MPIDQENHESTYIMMMAPLMATRCGGVYTPRHDKTKSLYLYLEINCHLFCIYLFLCIPAS